MRLLAVLAALLVLAPPAGASVVSAATESIYPEHGGPYPVQVVSVVAGAGEANAVVVDRARDGTMVRDAAGAQPGAGCVAHSPTDVRCPGPALVQATVVLGDGDDRVVLATPPDYGRAADLIVDGGSGSDRLVAGTANQATLGGGPGDDLLIGGGGWDRLDGGLGADELIGGAGVDAAVYVDRSEPLRLDRDGMADDGALGEGDRIEADVEQLVGGAGDDVLVGSDGNDTLDGAGGDDAITGLGGSDRLNGGAGDDAIDGGDGYDSLSGGPGADRLAGGSAGDTIDGDLDAPVAYWLGEPLVGTGADTIAGGSGGDTIDGRGGLDTIDPGAGRDRVDGGPDGATIPAQDGDADLIRCSRGIRAGTTALDALDLARACAGIERDGVARPRLLLLGQSEFDPDRIVRVSVGCSQDMPAACRGRLRISRHGRTLTRLPLRIRPGGVGRFRPRVPARLVAIRGRGLHQRCPHNAVTFTLRMRDAWGAPVVIRRRYVLIATALFCNSPSLDETAIDWE